jgi:hypothetical protein
VVDLVPLFFQDPDCRSPGAVSFLAYNPKVDLLPHAHFDGQTLWAIDKASVANYVVDSRCDESLGACECTNLPANTAAMGGVAHAVSVSFTPPFTVR